MWKSIGFHIFFYYIIPVSESPLFETQRIPDGKAQKAFRQRSKKNIQQQNAKRFPTAKRKGYPTVKRKEHFALYTKKKIMKQKKRGLKSMYELTTQQENIWKLQSFYEDSSISNITGILCFKELPDIEVLKKAVNLYVKYQEGARLRFVRKGGAVYQFVEEYEEFDIPVQVFEDFEHMYDYADKEARTPYHFGKNGEYSGCMYRFTIYKVKEQCGIIVNMNHLISDAWTLNIFCSTVINYYEMLSGKKEVRYEKFSYLDYVRKENKYLLSDKYKNDEEYWQQRFAEMPVRKRIKPEGKEDAGVSSKRISNKLSSELSSRIRRFCQETGYSPAIVFESVIFTYLSKINESGKETIIGVPVLNRTGKDKKIAGMFISTMPLGIIVNPSDTMSEICQKVADSHFEMFRHQKYPYSNIIRNVRKRHGFEGNLYDVLVSYQNAVVGKINDMEYETKWLCNGCSEVAMAFHVDDRDESGSFTVNMDVQEELFSEEEAGLLLERLLHMADVVTRNSNITVHDIPIMPEKEYELVVNKFNDTKIDYDNSLCVQDVFEKQAQLHSEQAALICDGQRLTYKQLSESSTKLAHYLRKKNVKRGDIVPIITTRSSHTIIAMLGIMKAGGAYLPIDYQYPVERVRYMIDESGAELVLICGEKSRQIAETLAVNYIDLEKAGYENISENVIDNVNCPEDKAYVIFTSGSTGKPKGTVLKHKGLVNFCLSDESGIALSSVFQHDVGDYCNNCLAIGSFSFDISLSEIFLALLNGNCVTVATEAEVNDADCLAELIVENRVDLINTTPTRMAFYMESDKFVGSMSGLKTILVAGEALPPELHRRIIQATEAKLFNGYGPTETTIGATFARMDNRQSVTIGKPIANTQIYIVDTYNNLCPIGVAGEICIAGNGVGEGYLNRPELTAQKFVKNPFATEENGHGARMYRTGDLARWREDGEIEFLGRIDTQVKIRGLRIELGEIENRLSEYDGVEQSAVTDKRDDNGRQILVGYYVSKQEIDVKELRKYMSAKLPNYMVPNYFMQLDEIPTNISGKTDRKNLPMPDLSDCEREYIQPQTATEKRLCNLYQKVLNVDRIGRTDNFFDMGGDSLTAMAMISELADDYSDISLQWIFEHPVVMELAGVLDGNKQADNTGNVDETPDFANRYKQYQNDLRNILTAGKKFTSENQCLTKKQGVILTGATGFLGAHILKSILEKGGCEIFCIVRGESTETAKKRLFKVVSEYFDTQYAECVLKEENVHIIVGDISQPDIDSIAGRIKSVCATGTIAYLIHAAALVKHYGAYEEFEKTNVTGTKQMIRLADKLGAEFIHISTESVGGLSVNSDKIKAGGLNANSGAIKAGKLNVNSDMIKNGGLNANSGAIRADGLNADSDVIRADGEVLFTENDIYIGQNLENVYIRSKFEAECCVIDYVRNGGRARIIRVGNLTNRYSDGRFQNNFKENAFLRRMKTFISLEAYPDMLQNSFIEFSPIDETAGAILTIVFGNRTTDMMIYHASNSQKLTYKQLALLFQNTGKVIKPVGIDVFVDMLEAGNTNHDYVRNDMLELGKMLKSHAVPVIPVNSETTLYLKENGFEWNNIGEKYIQNYVGYINNIEM